MYKYTKMAVEGFCGLWVDIYYFKRFLLFVKSQQKDIVSGK